MKYSFSILFQDPKNGHSLVPYSYGFLNDKVYIDLKGLIDIATKTLLASIQKVEFTEDIHTADFYIIWLAPSEKNYSILESEFSSNFNKYFNRTSEIDKVLTFSKKFTDNASYLKNNKIKPIIYYAHIEKSLVNLKFRYLDSSIWSRLAYKKELKSALEKTINNFEKNLFKLNVCNEYSEFSSRIIKNSYLVGKHQKVIPFQFHSETEMELRAKKGIEIYKMFEENTSLVKGLKWKVLLVDDKALVPLSLVEKDEDEQISLENYTRCKSFIIGKLLNEYDINVEIKTTKLKIHESIELKFSEELKKENPILTAEIHCVHSIAEAICILECEKGGYDIILLDYLLKDGSFGNHFLDKISKIEIPLQNKLFGRNWIFSISSYHSAFLDSIRNDGKTLISDKYYFERGADPINTPHLFVQQLCQFIGVQLREIGINENEGKLSFKNISEIWKECIGELGKLKSGKNKNFKRSWANNSLTKILNYWSKIESLKDAKEGGSLFANSFLNANDGFYKRIIKSEYDKGLYGYLTHLLFMLSFSDGYQWAEMKTNLDVIKQKVKSDANDSHKEGYEIIQKYIEDLKSAYDK